MAIHPPIPGDYQAISADSDFFCPLTFGRNTVSALRTIILPIIFLPLLLLHFSAPFLHRFFASSCKTHVDYQRLTTENCTIGAKVAGGLIMQLWQRQSGA